MPSSKQANYNQRATSLINIRLVHATEQDIIQHLAGQENKSGYIKRLIREDMARQKEQQN